MTGAAGHRRIARRRARGAAGVRAAAVALVVLAAGVAAADDPRPFIERGIDAYTRALAAPDRDERLALLGEAERLFAAAIEAGAHNADIETNRGNAALQQGRLGTAVLAYRRALLLDPGHARARANLAHARGLLPERIPRPHDRTLADTFFFWAARLPAEWLTTGAAVAFALGCAGLAGWLVRDSSRARTAALVAFALWGAALLAARLGPGRTTPDAGVVVAREAVARAADSVNAPRRFAEPLPGGTEVRILEDRGGWLQVALANGRTGWVAASAIEQVEAGKPEGSADATAS
jgi:tetratricopeptide (TPR) repeat protein